jgi:ribonucleoside-diphosphate reductase alpha chain
MTGLIIKRHFTVKGINPLDEVKWEMRKCVIKEVSGEVIFEMEGEVPSTWSQIATDIVISKYFRKAGLDKPSLKKDKEDLIKEGQNDG